MHVRDAAFAEVLPGVRPILDFYASKLNSAQRYGSGRSIVAAEFNGYRFVAAGKKIHWSKAIKNFPDFLNEYLHKLLANEWGSREVSLPLVEQHPIVQWRTIFSIAQQSQPRNGAGYFESTTGAADMWFRLAYDLYLIEHNADLQKRLIKRLRDRAAFQGARFEVAVAAMMLTAGYNLEFSAEKGPGKHPEFYATNKAGQRLAVEAKSRHRPGTLGYEGTRQEPVSFDIDGLLIKAVNKDPKEPLLVFIELNSPKTARSSLPDTVFHPELNESWKRVQALEWVNGFPAIGVVFYNDASAWFLDGKPPEDSAPVTALALWPDNSRHSFDVMPLLTRITQGCLQRLTIPHEFESRG